MKRYLIPTIILAALTLPAAASAHISAPSAVCSAPGIATGTASIDYQGTITATFSSGEVQTKAAFPGVPVSFTGTKPTPGAISITFTAGPGVPPQTVTTPTDCTPPPAPPTPLTPPSPPAPPSHRCVPVHLGRYTVTMPARFGPTGPVSITTTGRARHVTLTVQGSHYRATRLGGSATFVISSTDAAAWKIGQVAAGSPYGPQTVHATWTLPPRFCRHVIRKTASGFNLDGPR